MIDKVNGTNCTTLDRTQAPFTISARFSALRVSVARPWASERAIDQAEGYRREGRIRLAPVRRRVAASSRETRPGRGRRGNPAQRGAGRWPAHWPMA